MQEGGSAGSAIASPALCGALVGGHVVIVALSQVLIWGKLLVCPKPKFPGLPPLKGGVNPSLICYRRLRKAIAPLRIMHAVSMTFTVVRSSIEASFSDHEAT